MSECKGCKKRQEWLNDKVPGMGDAVHGIIGRRGILKSMASVAVALPFFKAQQATVASNTQAIWLLRLLNTAQVNHFENKGRLALLPELLTSAEMQEAINHQTAKNQGMDAAFVAGLNATGKQIIPGWSLSLTIPTSGTTFEASLVPDNKLSPTFSTAEDWIIHVQAPAAIDTTLAGRIHAAMFRCIGPIGLPGCCCQYPCCDVCWCCPGGTHCSGSFNCGCLCCVWCATCA